MHHSNLLPMNIVIMEIKECLKLQLQYATEDYTSHDFML
jgi:hypothetical protein